MKKIILLYLLAFLIRMVFAIPFVHDWDGYVFQKSAENLLKGETPYQTVVKNTPNIYPDSDTPMIQLWYAYPPLPLLMFTAPLGLSRLMGFTVSSPVKTSFLNCRLLRVI